MRGFIIYPCNSSHKKPTAFDWFINEAAKLDIELEVLFSEKFRLLSNNKSSILYENRFLDLPDFVIIRDYNLLLSNHFESLGVRVVNTTRSMELSKNKMLTHQTLAKSYISMPCTIYDTIQTYNYDELSRFFCSDKVILKSVEGAKGECVYLVKSQKEVDDVLKEAKSVVIAQEFIETSVGRDVRVWVVGDRVIGAVLRYSDSDFRSNFSLGGKVKSVELDDLAERLSVESVKALGLEFAGVDLMFTDCGYTVCEVNGNAGFRSLSLVSDVNVPFEVLKYIISVR